MKTLEIIAMIWAIIISLHILFGKITGASTVVILGIKFLSLITVLWFVYKLLRIIVFGY